MNDKARVLIIEDERHRAREIAAWFKGLCVVDIALNKERAQELLHSDVQYYLALIKLTMAGTEDSQGPLRIIIEEKPKTKVVLMCAQPVDKRQRDRYMRNYPVVAGFIWKGSLKAEFLQKLAQIFLDHTPLRR